MSAAGNQQRGAVALELALSLPVLLTLLVALVFYGRVMYHYEVAQKAAWVGVRYLSSVPAINMKNQQQAAQEVALATDLIRTELSALAPAPGSLYVSVNCDNAPCGLYNILPAMINVTIIIDVPGDLSGYGETLTHVRVRANHNLRYVGN